MKKQTHLSFFVLILIVGTLLAACGSLPAGATDQAAAGDRSVQVVFSGTVDSISSVQWVVAGQAMFITPQTSIDSSIVVGDVVKVEAVVAADGTVTATRIEHSVADPSSTPAVGGGDNSNLSSGANQAEFFGVVETINADSWIVSGLTFAVNAQTEIKDTIAVGDSVKVEAAVNANGTFTATQIQLGTSSGSGSNSTGLEVTGKIESITADLWTVSGMKFTVDASTEIKGTFNIGDLVKVHLQVRADGTFLAREIKAPDTASATPQSTEQSGVGLEFTGVVQSIGPSSWVVGGRTFAITSQTEIKGTIVVGDTVKVETFGNLKGSLTAREIRKVDAFSGSTPVPSSEAGDDHGGGSSSTDVPSSTAGPTDDHGGGSGKP